MWQCALSSLDWAPSTVRCYSWDRQVYEMGDEPLGHHVIIVISCHITSLCWLWSVNFSTSPEVGSCWSEVQSSLVAKQWQPGPSWSRWFPPRKAPEIFGFVDSLVWFCWVFLSSFCHLSVNLCLCLPLTKVMTVLPVDRIRLCSVVPAQTNHDSTWFTVPTRPIFVF